MTRVIDTTILDPRRWGADETGVSDSTAAIQACINDAPAGATVELPPGTCRITAGVSLGSKPLLVRGGPGSTVDADYLAATPAFSASGPARFSDLTLTGSGTPAHYAANSATILTGNALRNWSAILLTGTDASVERIHVSGFYTGVASNLAQRCRFADVTMRGPVTGTTPDSSSGIALYLIGGKELQVTGLVAIDCSVGLIVGGSAEGVSVAVANGRNLRTHLVYLSSALGATVSDWTLDGSTSSAITTRGDDITVGRGVAKNVGLGVSASGFGTARYDARFGGRGLIVEGVTVENATASAVGFNDFADAGFFLRDVTVTGCTFHDCNQSIAGTFEFGSISDNTIGGDSGTTAAIVLSSAGSSTAPEGIGITGNTIEGCAAEGIRVGNLRRAVIAGNRGKTIGNVRWIRLLGVQNSAVYGNVTDSGRIDEDSVSSGNLIAGNISGAANVLAGSSPRSW